VKRGINFFGKTVRSFLIKGAEGQLFLNARLSIIYDKFAGTPSTPAALACCTCPFLFEEGKSLINLVGYKVDSA
jgi:hypothetical protein